MLLPFCKNSLLIKDVFFGLHLMLRSLSDPIADHSRPVSNCLIKLRISGPALFEMHTERKLLMSCLKLIKIATNVPDINSLRAIKRKIKQQRRQALRLKNMHSGRGSITGRGRGGRGRGRGRGIFPISRGRGINHESGRGRGRGRGKVVALAPSKVKDNDTKDSASDNDLQPYIFEFDVNNRWSVATFVILFDLLEICILDVVDNKGRIIHRSMNLLPNWCLSLVVAHCHSTVNIDDELNNRLRFPSAAVSSLLLRAIAIYDRFVNACQYGLCQISPAMNECSTVYPLEQKLNEEKCNENELIEILNNVGCLSRNDNARKCALRALSLNKSVYFPQSIMIVSRIWILCHDKNDDIKNMAKHIWTMFDFKLENKNNDILHELMVCLNNNTMSVRKSCAESISNFSEMFDNILNDAINNLISEYINDDSQRSFRHGISLTLSYISTIHDLEQSKVICLLDFLLKYGVYDVHENVYKQNLECGRKLFLTHGNDSSLTSIFFNKLDAVLSTIKNEQTRDSDYIRQAIVIYNSCLIEQISSDNNSYNNRITEAMAQLIDVIQTPSHEVQCSVAENLEKLIQKPILQKNAKTYVRKLMIILTTSQSRPARMGAAIGLSAIVKGLKIPCVSSLGIMNSLTNAVKNNKSAIAREGALVCYTQLFTVLGTAFEPFVIKVLPHLLNSFSDNNPNVRKATTVASKAVMKNLSNFGIKMVLPIVLRALDKNDWRTKVQAVSMLGSMAYCAPKVLATYLPQIIPKLCTLMIDPRKEVAKAASNSLKNIGSVIRNPEIQSLVPLLMRAITSSSSDSIRCALQALIDTSFTNVVDVPSLALLIPILGQAMRDRSSMIKKMAAQVIGGICSLIAEPQSIMPYVPQLIDGIKSILCDPIPEVRTAAAMAIRSFNETLGEKSLPGMYEWLMTLVNDETTNNVQRFGAAQGLSELVASYPRDVNKVQEILPELLEGLLHTNFAVRESFVQIFVYLPKALDDEFPYFLDQIVPCLLPLLGDDHEPVRSVTLRALKIMVYMFHKMEYDLLLDLLEEGLDFPDNQIRESTLILVGDLLNGLANNTGSISFESTATLLVLFISIYLHFFEYNINSFMNRLKN